MTTAPPAPDQEGAGRSAFLFVAWSLGVCGVCAAAYASLERMPGWTYDLVTRGLFTLAMTGFLAAMTVALVAGPRTLRARITRRGVTLTACGLLLAAAYVIAPAIWYSRSRSRMEEIQASGRAWKADLRQRLESGQVPEDLRERMWQIYARALFKDEGITARIPDGNGGQVSFEPSEADIAARDAYLETLERLQAPPRRTGGAAIWVALCLAAGLLWPARRPPAVPSPADGDHKPGTAPAAGE